MLISSRSRISRGTGRQLRKDTNDFFKKKNSENPTKIKEILWRPLDLHLLVTYGAFPLPDSDSYSDYCTDSNSMQKCSTGTDSYGDSYANHRHLASLFEKLIVVSIDPLLACLVIPTTGLYNNFHSLNK